MPSGGNGGARSDYVLMWLTSGFSQVVVVATLCEVVPAREPTSNKCCAAQSPAIARIGHVSCRCGGRCGGRSGGQGRLTGRSLPLEPRLGHAVPTPRELSVRRDYMTALAPPRAPSRALKSNQRANPHARFSHPAPALSRPDTPPINSPRHRSAARTAPKLAKRVCSFASI